METVMSLSTTHQIFVEQMFLDLTSSIFRKKKMEELRRSLAE